MKKKNVQQEVLVLTETSFALRAMIKLNGDNKKHSSTEEMEDRIWNGLLNEMLPELMIPVPGAISNRYIWKVTTCEFLILVDLGEEAGILEESYSINPSLFVSTTRMN